jgi:hypothetical protein
MSVAFKILYIRYLLKNVQSRETDNIVHKRLRKAKQKHNTICVRQHYIQTNTNKKSLKIPKGESVGQTT